MLDALPAERTIPVRIIDESALSGGAGSATASLAATSTGMNDVAMAADAMAMESDKAATSVSSAASQISYQTQSKLGDTPDGMGGVLSRTTGHLSNLTGGMAGFIPMMAGLSLYSAIDQFGQFGHQVDLAKNLMGGTAQQASLWTGAANLAGVSSQALAMTFKGLQSNLDSVRVSMDKHTVSAQAMKAAQDAVTLASNNLEIAQNKVAIAQDAYTKAVDKYGASSSQALTAQDALITAQDGVSSSTDKLTNEQSKLSNMMQGVSPTLTKVTAGLQDLGISIFDNNGKMKTSNELLMEMADAYANSNDQARATQDILAVLGNRAYQILPLMQQGSAGIQQLMQQTQANGNVLNDQSLKAALTAETSLNSIKQSMHALILGIAQDAMPYLDFINTHFDQIKTGAEVLMGLIAAKLTIGWLADLKKDLGDLLGTANTLSDKLTGIGNQAPRIGGGGSASNPLGNAIDATKGMRVYGGPVEILGGTGTGGGGLPGAGLPLGAAAPELGTVATGGGALAGIPVLAATTVAVLGSLGIYDQTQKPQNQIGLPGLPAWHGTDTGSQSGQNLANWLGSNQSNYSSMGDPAMIADITTQFQKDYGLTLQQAQAATQAFLSKWEHSNNVTGASVDDIVMGITHIAQNSTQTAQQTDLLHISAGNIFKNFEMLNQYGQGWAPLLVSELGKVGLSAGDAQVQMGDIATLVKNGNITSGTELETYINNVKALAQHAQNSSSAQAEYETLIANGTLPLGTDINQFIAAWNFSQKYGGNVMSDMQVIQSFTRLASESGQAFQSDLQNLAQQTGVSINSIISGYTASAAFAQSMALYNQEISGLLAQGVTTARGAQVPVGDIRGLQSGGIVGMAWGGMTGVIRHAQYGLPASSTPILVGENGPELFKPAGAGEIIPNHRLQTLGGGGGGDMYNFDLRGSQMFSPADMDMLIKKMGERFVRTTLPQAGVRITRG